MGPLVASEPDQSYLALWQVALWDVLSLVFPSLVAHGICWCGRVCWSCRYQPGAAVYYRFWSEEWRLERKPPQEHGTC